MFAAITIMRTIIVSAVTPWSDMAVLNERISGWISECVVDTVDGEEIGNEENDGHDAVRNVTPENGDGDVSSSISDFFGDVGSCIGT